MWQGEPLVVREALRSINYDPCPLPSINYFEKRLQSATILAENKIPAVVFGHDALFCAFEVPYEWSYTLQLLVAEEDLERAALTLLAELQTYARYPAPPNSRFGDLRPEDTPRRFMLDEISHPPEALATSVCLRSVQPPPVTSPDSPYHAPSYIILTPSSFFNFDISNIANTKSLPGFPPGILFPTLIPLLDSLSEAQISPNLEYQWQGVLLFDRLAEHVFPDAEVYRRKEDIPAPVKSISKLLKGPTQETLEECFMMIGPEREEEE
ncbi:hypothetical protein OF83DRAFT_48164 [Amylostereum chailletii]|nr:hypothetical protein OF83DRAFT_48164 [Amylostereum chailletii]